MKRLIVSPDARRDIAAILRESARYFGSQAARRYARLITQAQADLRRDSARPGVTLHAGATSARLFHLRHSRKHVAQHSRVGTPRHIIAFHIVGDTIEIVRVLHDAMDIEAHLPPAEE